MSIILLVVSWLMGGLFALLYFIGCALVGKALLEVVNYIEHYGLVRDKTTRVQPRHSWNSNRRISSWSMFNLTRHSHHHAQAGLPYHKLKPMDDAPTMISGYMGCMFLTMIPPLWRKLMQPKLADWDKNYASEQEKLLIKNS